ncbi:MAG TPA: hypothetical protein VF300_03050 [Methanothrix sp.]
MRFRNASMILMLAVLLLANGATATKCVIYVVDEYNMAVGSARIYIDNSTSPIGMTAYNAGLGRNAWIGDISQSGEHTLTAKWTKARPNPVSYEGTAAVNIAGNSTMRITIATRKV